MAFEYIHSAFVVELFGGELGVYESSALPYGDWHIDDLEDDDLLLATLGMIPGVL
jgi:hypothetical protein